MASTNGRPVMSSQLHQNRMGEFILQIARQPAGRAVLVAWSRWFAGVGQRCRTQPQISASPTGLLLSATVPGVLTGVVPGNPATER